MARCHLILRLQAARELFGRLGRLPPKYLFVFCMSRTRLKNPTRLFAKNVEAYINTQNQM